MTHPTDAFKLEYELTLPERSAISLRRSGPARNISTLAYLFVAVVSVGVSAWWLTSMYLAMAAATWFAPRWGVWLAAWAPSLVEESSPREVLIDTTGIRVCNPSVSKISPTRYWWSRLSEIREDALGVTLLYDTKWWRLVIPWKAFADADQQRRFLEIARQHLATDAPSKRSVLSTGQFQKAS